MKKYNRNIVGLSLFIYKMNRFGNRIYCRKDYGFLWKLVYVLYRFIYFYFCSRVGCFIPLSTRLPDGLIAPHGFYGVFISKNAIIGENVTILHHVTIGSNPLSSNPSSAPIIGDGCFIGAGAKVIGNVSVPDNEIVKVNEVRIERRS